MNLVVQRLTLAQFRSYSAAEFDFGASTVIVGPNACGKTNLLEALYLLTSGKSFRADRESEMVRWGETAGRVQAEFDRAGIRREAAALLSSAGRMTQKTFLIDGKKRLAKDLPGLFPMVLFSADDVRLIDGSPGRRRRALDLAISQGDPAYRAALSAYQKALAGRNRLLERIAAGESTSAELEAWDGPLTEAGQTVVDRRQAYFSKIARPLRAAYRDLISGSTGVATDLTAAYRPLTEDVAGEIPRRRDQDLAVGTTTAGPHRDDWLLLLGKRPVLSFGSGGEFRSSVLAWRLADAARLAELADVHPIVLLDDVFSELDEHRRGALLGKLPRGQVIITTPEAAVLPKSARRDLSVIDLPARSPDRV